jgi:beta-lactamase regulating signal transducer with metallopeptidase domain
VTAIGGEITAAVLALAWFAAINAGMSLLVFAASWLFHDRLDADAWRARRLLAVRLAPAAASLMIAGTLFLPAHAWLEPARSDERIGLVVLTLAGLGLALLLVSGARWVAAMRATSRLTALPRSRELQHGRTRLREVQGLRGITLAGIVRPRILIGSRARQVLSPAELELAVAHERAHQHARDNLSRMLLHCAPDFFGWSRPARRLERLWEGEAECLADAAAAAGSPLRATRLAAALVKVARLGGGGDPAWAAGWSAFHHPVLLETRVRRLISRPQQPPAPGNVMRAAAAWAIGVVGTAWIAGIPQRLHAITEELIARLP